MHWYIQADAATPQQQQQQQQQAWSSSHHQQQQQQQQTAVAQCSPEAAALAQAQFAMWSVTCADVAELKAFTAPHPAVVRVAAAVGVLLCGKLLPWSDLRKLLAQHDNLLDTLR
jgi:Microtubule-binding stalk of dynein motor